jgi:hypothetical protein
MGTKPRNENLPKIRTRFNTRPFVLIAMSILLCVGIAGCEAGPGTTPGAFVLSSPVNGATGIWLAPTLTWTDADGETSYTVEIDDENTFSPPLTHQDTGIASGTTSFVVPGGVLAGGTTYYWRVAAINSAGSTTASNSPFSFTVLSSGALAPGFGAAGFVTSDPSTGMDRARDIAIDSTAMYVVGYDYSPGNYQWRIEKRSLTDGSLVPGFGTGGVITSNPSTGSDVAFSIAIDSTAMYVVGYDYSPDNYQWRIEKRSLIDGSLVPGFGTGGVVASNPSTGSDQAWDIAIDSTATYVVGYDGSPGNNQWRMEKRSLTDGSLVPEFGTGGVVTINPSTGSDVARSISIDSTAMYVVGYDYSTGNDQWRIEKRSLADGSLLSGFGTGGVATSNPSTSYDAAFSISIDSTAMYVVGYDSSPENWQWRIEKRSLADGNLVPGFGTGGVVTSDPTTGADVAYSINIDSTAMYVVGYDIIPENNQWRVEKRSLADGSLVTGFGTGGVVTSDPSTGDDVAYDIAIDSTAMYVVGYDSIPGNSQWHIEKRSLADGSLVPGFGTGGVVTNNPSTGSDYARSIAIDSTAMYVVGYDYSPGNYQWRIEKRSLVDGSLVGVFTSNPSTDDDIAYSIAIDSTAIYVVGYDESPGDSQWRIEKRSLAEGSLVPGFGTGGAVTINPSTDDDIAYSIAIDSTAMYVVGYDESPGDSQWRIEKRSLADGSLVPGFGTGGVVTINPSTGPDVAYSIAIESTALYLVGYDGSPGNSQWRIEKRSLADGSLVPGFGTGGVVTINPSTGPDVAYSIAIESTGMYVVGCDSSPGNRQWRIEKRSSADGSLVSGFGTGGAITSNPSTGSDVALSIAIDTAAMYVVGYDGSPGSNQWRMEKRVK